MLDERLSDRRAGPRDHVEHAGRQPRLARDLREGERRQRRLAGGLPDDGVAAGERGRHFPDGQQQREVPRHDRRHDAQRLAHV
jgi:hypothetical protein